MAFQSISPEELCFFGGVNPVGTYPSGHCSKKNVPPTTSTRRE